MDNQFKRPNKLTGEPFELGFKDESEESSKVFLNKHGVMMVII